MTDDKPDIHTIRFIALVDSFYGAAMTFLGKVTDPATGKARRELDKAQAYIDFLSTLEVKTRGNLSGPEGDHLARLLGDLRLNYVDEMEAEKSEKKESEKEEKEAERDGENEEESGEPVAGNGEKREGGE